MPTLEEAVEKGRAASSACDAVKVENGHFAVHLPDGWEERANEDGFEWVTPDGVHQLIVSVFLPNGGADLRSLLESLMTIRQEQFAKLAAAGALVPLGVQADGDSWIGSMIGVDVARRVQAYVRLVATPVRIVTASVFRYGTIDDQAGFVERAEEICSTLTVSRGPGEPAKPGWRRFLPW